MSAVDKTASGKDPAAPEAPPAGLPKYAFLMLFMVQAVVAVGNTGMQSVLPAIGRSVGIPDFLVSAIFSLSALCWAGSSPWWARMSDARGRKPLILVGLTGFAVSMILCGVVVSLGLQDVTPPVVTFALFLFARAIFGFFGAAANPATQAYIAERTSRDERTQAMATLAGAFGMGTLGGPVLAPMFVHIPMLGLAGPMFAFAVIALVMLFVILRFLTEPPVAKAKSAKRYSRASFTETLASLFKDPVLTPFLVYGFIITMTQSALSQTLGFLVIDKQNLPPLAAQSYIMIAMMGGAVAGLLAQWGMIRTFNMTPRDLLLWGAGLAGAGSLIIAFAPGYGSVVVGFAVANLGFGFARPGFTAGASLSVPADEQARAAGALAAVNGVNVVFAPLFVLMYEAVAWTPFVLIVAIMAALVGYALRNPSLANVNDQSPPDGVVTKATLERRDEGGGV